MVDIKTAVGKQLYTVNATACEVDSWLCVAVLPNIDEPRLVLTRDTKTMTLPRRAVFETFDDAFRVLNLGKIFN